MHVVYGVPFWHDWILSRPSFQITIVSVDLLFVQSRFLLQIFGESILVSLDSYVAMSCRYNIPGAVFTQPWHWHASTVKKAMSLQQQYWFLGQIWIWMSLMEAVVFRENLQRHFTYTYLFFYAFSVSFVVLCVFHSSFEWICELVLYLHSEPKYLWFPFCL